MLAHSLKNGLLIIYLQLVQMNVSFVMSLDIVMVSLLAIVVLVPNLPIMELVVEVLFPSVLKIRTNLLISIPSIFTTYMSNYTLENVGDQGYHLENYNLYKENDNIDNIDIDNIDYEYQYARSYSKSS